MARSHYKSMVAFVTNPKPPGPSAQFSGNMSQLLAMESSPDVTSTITSFHSCSCEPTRTCKRVGPVNKIGVFVQSKHLTIGNTMTADITEGQPARQLVEMYRHLPSLQSTAGRCTVETLLRVEVQLEDRMPNISPSLSGGGPQARRTTVG